ncbi:MAG: diphosphomevalonate decarboxylase [Pseudomonadota bacterium]
MADAARQVVAAAMAQAGTPKPFTAYAPSNIALAKYWGKRDAARNLPLNSSLSISLNDWGSRTTVAPSASGADEVILNGDVLPGSSAFAQKVVKFADLFRGERAIPLRVETHNTVPTAAGLASSASGFAALTKALCGSFGLSLTASQMSIVARLGSGSAARSLWHGFVCWNRGDAVDGSDSHGVPLDGVWPEFRIAIVKVDTSPKAKSSRDGMEHTRDTSPLFQAWPAQADADCGAVERAILDRDFVALGERTEGNALMMHATMQAARPSLSYLTSRTWAALEVLWRMRADGLQAFATMDAGPNLKLIFLEPCTSDVLAAFPEADVVEPFAARANGS